MKFKAVFSLAILLIVLFSIGMAAAADENTTEPLCEVEEIENDTLEIADEACLNESSNQPVELIVDIASDCNSYYRQGNIIKWTITVKSTGGTAQNTVVDTRFDGVELISHYTKTGTYNKSTRLWKLGNLAPNKVACLTIKTRAIQNSENIIGKALARSENDAYETPEFHNTNYAQKMVKLVRKNNITIGSNDLNNTVHQYHYFSSENSQKTDFYSSTETETFNESVKAASSYKQVGAGNNTTHLDTENMTPDDLTKSDNEPFSLSKVAVYLSENKFLPAIAIIILVLMIVTVYKKR